MYLKTLDFEHNYFSYRTSFLFRVSTFLLALKLNDSLKRMKAVTNIWPKAKIWLLRERICEPWESIYFHWLIKCVPLFIQREVREFVWENRKTTQKRTFFIYWAWVQKEEESWETQHQHSTAVLGTYLSFCSTKTPPPPPTPHTHTHHHHQMWREAINRGRSRRVLGLNERTSQSWSRN